MNTTIEIGSVWKDWTGEQNHRLWIDLSGLLPVWLVDTGKELFPLSTYLRQHPDRAGEVKNVIQERLR